MRKLIIIFIATLVAIFNTGCSATFGLVWDGEKWGISLGGEVPQISIFDYEKEIK